MRCGGAIAISSTRRTCTGRTGRRFAQRYSQLLPYVAHRSDLNYVIGEMIAELTVQHTYIDGGDMQLPAAAARGTAGRAIRG